MRTLLLVLAAGLAVRLWLVLVVVPGAGASGDMDLFLNWGDGFLERGPAGFYSGDGTANYPPLDIWMLGATAAIARWWGGGDAFSVLLKVPPVVADVGIAAIVAVLVRRRSTERVALVAAVVAVLLPVYWYDSVLWGQVDSILALLMIGSIGLLITDRPVAAAVMAVLAWSFKPQGLLSIVLVAAVLLSWLIRGRDAGPDRAVRTVIAATASSLATFLLVILPFDYERLAPPTAADIPIVGDIAGLVAQNLFTAQLFPVLTANAENVWALVGPHPLASTMGPTAKLTPDATEVLGVPAGTIGLIALGIATVAVVLGLVVRSDGTAVLLASTVLTTAFFAFPTRSHERYLIPAFATATVLAAPHVLRLIGLIGLAVVNTVNMHAVLAGAGPSQVIVASPTTSASKAIQLGAGDAVRQEWLVVLCSLLQTGAGIALLAVWCVFMVRTVRHGSLRSVRNAAVS